MSWDTEEGHCQGNHSSEWQTDKQGRAVWPAMLGDISRAGGVQKNCVFQTWGIIDFLQEVLPGLSLKRPVLGS